jgi:3-polyprenyl-4-hydroxybenzoate decarboxylase
MRRTITFTTPDQSNRTPQTIAIGPKPATMLAAMSTTPTTMNAAVMIQKERACLMVPSLSSPPRVVMILAARR